GFTTAAGLRQIAFHNWPAVDTRTNPLVGSLSELSVASKSQNSESARLRGATTNGVPFVPRAFCTCTTSWGGAASHSIWSVLTQGRLLAKIMLSPSSAN